MSTASRKIVFFDGKCNFCNAVVDLLVRRDRLGELRYSSLQSDFSRRFFAARDIELDPEHLERLFYLRDDELHSRSGAALRICRELSGGWPLLSLLLIVPAPLRDRIYDLVARNRYRIFGRRPTCRAPAPDERGLFLEE